MDNLPLSRGSSAVLTNNTEPQKTQNSVADSDSRDFNDRLNEQIQSTNRADKTKKVTDNQTDSIDEKKSGNEQNNDTEEPTEVVAAETPTETTALKDEGIEGGNELPKAAIFGSLIEPSSEKTSAKSEGTVDVDVLKDHAKLRLSASSQMPLNAQKNTPTTNSPQTPSDVDAVEVTAEKTVSVDAFKTLVNKQSQNSVPMAEGRLNPASVVQQLSVANQLQQVPASTVSAALNLNTPSLTADITSANPLSNLQSSINSNVQSSSWPQGVAEKLSIMMGGQMQRADIKLNPANLGPLEIKLSLKDDQASVSFISQHSLVREALDQALPRLRDMFEQQGVELVNVDISQHSAEQQSNSDNTHSGQTISDSSDNSSSAEAEINIETTLNRENISIAGGVSIFA